MSSTERALRRFAGRSAKIGILGLGYAGLPLALCFAEADFETIGFDVDPLKVDKLNGCASYIGHIPNARLASVIRNRRFRATTDFSLLSQCDATIICVPTPLGEGRTPNLKFVVDTTHLVAEHLRPGQLVVLESTTYPGTTDEVLLPALSARGHDVGKDFFLAFSPEREDPANSQYNTRTIPKVVGGVTANCLKVACAAYQAVVERVVPVSSARTAEAAKLLENVYRCVNIAMANELKLLFERMGIDVWEVIHAAATKPFGFAPFYPGPGLGGHCVPIDPFYLTWKARQFDFPTRFIELAGEINSSMPEYVVDRLAYGLNLKGKALKNARILLIGVAYKRDIDDVRESPALTIIQLLEKRLARVSYHDPHVPSLRSQRLDRELASVPLIADTVAAADAVIIVTDHTEIDYRLVLDHAKLVVDTRNATALYRREGDQILMA